jgi:hypothetical protein
MLLLLDLWIPAFLATVAARPAPAQLMTNALNVLNLRQRLQMAMH